MTMTIDGSLGATFPAGGLGNPAGAVVGTTDTQTLTNKTLTTPNIDSAQFATVSGTAPLYACRAWVNFNGTGTVAIRASGNVSSITDNGTGDYTVNFTTAMPDVNYVAVATAKWDNTVAAGNIRLCGAFSYVVGSVRLNVLDHTPSMQDALLVNLSIFR